MPNPTHTIASCYVCGGGKFRFLFSKNGWRIEACRNCGFVFVNPRYGENEAAEIYNEEGWFFSGRNQDGKKNYATEELASVQRAGKIVGKLRSMRSGPARSLLEIGCGLGYVLDAAKKAGLTATGLDISKEAVAICREKGHEAYAGTLGDLIAKSTAKFDIITAFDVFEHICEPLAFLADIKKLANPGALIVMSVPNVHCLAAKLRGKSWSQFILPEHINYFDSSTIRRIMEGNGFAIEEIHSEPSITFGLRPALRSHLAKGRLAKPVTMAINMITRFKRYVFYPPINWFVRKTGLEANLLLVFARAI